MHVAARDKFITAVSIVGVLYALFQFTPSSYALALKAMGIAHTGLLFGTAHPMRSDEWSVWTPYMQIAVNNGFARMNALSPYGEDLRNFNALPLWDWGLLFKPQLWSFFLLPPAAAFSLMFAIYLSTCLIGWYLLAIEFGFERRTAAVFSLTIFALPCVQLWWTSTGPLVAFLPWLLLAHLVRVSNPIRVPMMAWTAATFMLSQFYVPFIAMTMFGAALLIVAFRPDSLRLSRSMPSATACAIGALFVLLYLWGPIKVMADTVYPGHRTGVPGGLIPNTFVLAHLFPHFISAGWSAFYWNDLEIGTGGSYALLFALVFTNIQRLPDVLLARTNEDRAMRWTLAVLCIGIVLILAWWRLPLPAAVGKLLLWDTTVPQRLALSAGLLSHAVAFVLLLRVGAIASLARVAIAIGLIVIAAVASKFVFFSGGVRGLVFDLLIIALLLIALLVPNAAPNWGRRLLLCGAFSNALLFVSFNPIQKAGPIFAKHDTPILRRLAAKQAAHPRCWLVDNAFPGSGLPGGALLVGLGFRAIQHVLIAPRLAFFRERFPDLPADQFTKIFNRYAHIQLDPAATTPYVPRADVVRVPPDAFR